MEERHHKKSDSTLQFCTLLFFNLGLFHLVVADEFSVAAIGFHQGLVVSSLLHLAIIQKHNVITELQILFDTSEDNHVNKSSQHCGQSST